MSHPGRALGRLTVVAFFAVSVAALGPFPGAAAGNRPLRVTYLALDHGYAALVEPPESRGVLINAGAPSDVPELRRMLKKRQVHDLMAIFVNTWRESHFGGVVPLLKSERISGLILNPLRIHSRAGDAMLAYAQKREATHSMAVHAPAPGETITFFYTPPCQLRMVAPAGAMLPRYENDPDCSSVLELSYQHISLLDLGQTRREHQKAMWNVVGEKPRGQVLAIGRGGADDALLPSLLRPLRTRIAVLQIPRKSGGKPGTGTLKALREAGVKVYRTDRDGSVQITTDGDRIDVKTGV